LVAKLELATGSKISSTDRQKLGHSSLKQFGGLTVPQIRTCKQNPNAPKRQIPFHWKALQIFKPIIISEAHDLMLAFIFNK